MKALNWLLGLLLMVMPAWYHSLKNSPALPAGVKAAEEVNRTKTAAKAATAEAAAGRGLGARMMPNRGFMTGAGLAATIAFLLWPEITDAMKGKATQHATSDQRDDQRRFEKQARAAQDVTATEDERDEQPTRQPQNVSREEDEQISAQKNYQPDDHWKWKHDRWSPRNEVCRWAPIDYEWEEYRCHQRFERPVAYPRPNRRAPRYEYGPNVMGPDKRAHRTRRELPPGVIAASSGRGGCRGGCPYNGG